MAVSAIRRAPLAALLMLGCSAIAVPAQAGWFDFGSKPAAASDVKNDVKTGAKNDAAQPATNLEDSIRQAQMLRLAGNYPDAIKHLSQLMMVAGDDPRIISEYGKTLAAMGRPSDAVNFLTRAQQLQPGDWTVYSALGVAYDQIGDQTNAQVNYELALKINPEEPSVLSNYALSRMLAKDPEKARSLAARAESAGGNRDPLIGRNIAMIRSVAPEVAQHPQAAQTTVPAPVAAAPHAPVAIASTVQPQAAPVSQGDNRVVMQKVPVDPLAGPVQSAAKPATSAVVATNAPRPLLPKTVAAPVATAMAPPAPVKAAEMKPAKIAEPAPAATAKLTPAVTVKAAEAKPAAVKTAAPAAVATAKVTPAMPVKAAEVKPAPVKTTAPAAVAKVTPAEPMKAAEVKPVPVKTTAPAAVATAKLTPVPVKAAEAKPVLPAKVAAPAAVATAKAATPMPVKAAEAAKPMPSVTLKMVVPVSAKTAEAAKQDSTPKVLASTPVKTAEAKPVPVKAVVKTKDAIPGLRLSANAY